jgi:Cft2 family RNA processing exonuclease
MARTRTTPYPAQLETHLGRLNGKQVTMSALTLADQFTHPSRGRATSRLGGIHKALRQAWADGKLITFIDAQGNVLREDRFGSHGSAAVEHPQIFATDGTPSPADGYTAATYQQYLDARGGRNGDGDLAADQGDALASDQPGGEPDERPDAEPDDDRLLTREELVDALGEELVAALPSDLREGTTVAELDSARQIAEVRAWRPSAPPPDWTPEAVLCRWATTPAAVTYWRQGLDRATKADRARLLRCGVRRKGPIEPGSLTARGLAEFVRNDLEQWQAIGRMAVRHYQSADDLALEDIPLIAADPVVAYVDEGIAVEVVLLVGFALDLDEQALREIASDLSDENLGVLTTAEEKLRFQAENQAAEAADLRDQLRKTEKELGKVTKERDALTDTLERMRAVELQAGSVEKQLAEEQARLQDANRQIADLEVDLEVASADAIEVDDLTTQVQALEALRDQLLAEASTVESERALRAAAEDELQQQIRKVGELTRQLRDAAQGSALPVSDGPSLIAALRGPLAQAAAHAAERMATGQSTAGDAELLSFASTFAAFAEKMPAATASATEPPPTEPAPAEPAGEPADTIEPAISDAEPETPADVGAVVSETPTSELADASADDQGESETRRRRRRERRIPEFTLRPVGGAGEVGGSAILVQTRKGSNVLLDAGQRVKGEYGPESANQFHYGIPGVDHLHGILISHAHIDHIGSLPLIHQRHSDLQDAPVPVLMSGPTRALGEIMLNDSAKIQHAREQTLAALAESDFGEGAMEAAYTFADVNACLSDEHLTIVDQYRPVPIPDTGLVARYLPVSHVLGSCAIHLTDSQTGATLLYTGDLGPLTEPQLTLPDFGGTQMIDKAAVLMMESTYGLLREEEREGRRRSSAGRERATAILCDIATQTIDGGGHVLLPAFSLGRTQELAMIIGQNRGANMPDGRIYVAGMGEKITEIYDNFDRPSGGGWRRPGEFPTPTQIRKWLTGGRTFQDVVGEVLESEPGYIIASPAMLSSGWSRAFLDAMLDHSRHAVVFTGYLPKHAGNIPNLREMYQGANMRLDGENRKIACRWEKLSLSAHAPSVDLERFARDLCQGRETVHIGLVHGTAEAQRELAERLTHQLTDATVRSLRNGEPWIPGRA